MADKAKHSSDKSRHLELIAARSAAVADTVPTKEPTLRSGIQWMPAGQATTIPLLTGTGGFVLLKVDQNVNPGTSYHVALFVAKYAFDNFVWSVPAGTTGGVDWFVVDVPRGFSINAGERMWKTMGGNDPDDAIKPDSGEPVIVHGHP